LREEFRLPRGKVGAEDSVVLGHGQRRFACRRVLPQAVMRKGDAIGPGGEVEARLEQSGGGDRGLVERRAVNGVEEFILQVRIAARELGAALRRARQADDLDGRPGHGGNLPGAGRGRNSAVLGCRRGPKRLQKKEKYAPF